MVYRILAAVLFVLLGLPASAKAFCRTTTCAATVVPPSCGDPSTLRDADGDGCLTRGNPLYWEQPCVSFAVERNGSRFLEQDFDTLDAVVAKSFAAWQNTWCDDGYPSILAVDFGRLECDHREYNSTGPNNNGIFFIDEDWPHKPDAIALTTVSFDAETGKISGADMEINTENYPLTPTTLEFVVTHEAGHFFGLDHSPNEDAIMYFAYSIFDGASEPVLTRDDIAAICAVYPPSREVVGTCEPEPKHGYATDCGGNVFGTCAVGAGGPRRPEAPGFLALAGVLGLIELIRGRRSTRKHTLLVVPPQRV